MNANSDTNTRPSRIAGAASTRTPGVAGFLNQIIAAMKTADQEIDARYDLPEAQRLPSPWTPEQEAQIGRIMDRIEDARRAELRGDHEASQAALKGWLQTFCAFMKSLHDALPQSTDDKASTL